MTVVIYDKANITTDKYIVSTPIGKKTKSKAPALEAKNQIKIPYCTTADEAAVVVESLRDACFIASRCSTPISFSPEFRPNRESSHTL